MKTNRKALAALSIVAAGALALTACGGGSETPKTSESSAGNVGGSASVDPNAATTTAIITTNGTEPQMPLVPTNTTEVGGGKIIDLTFAGLMTFDAKGDPVLDQAASVEPNADNTQWTIKLRDGIKFSDGTPVTSDSFIKAWNYGADLANKQGSSTFFENIKGYDGTKSVATLSGLKKVSDTEFTVDLTNPEATFKLRLGYSAFVPLPESAFTDMKAFGENPVGNGPYKLASQGAWKHKVGISLVKNDVYDGPRVAKNGGVNITFYASLDAAYAAAQSKNGTLDILDQVPPSAFTTYESDFPDSNVNQSAAIFQAFTIPQYLEHFKSDTEEGKLRRQAISLSIDRATITDKIFNGTRTPAKDFTSPVLAGWDTWGKNLAGNDVLNFDATKAKDLWAKADAISKYDGDFTISYNADGGHKEWVDAVSGMISQNLGIKAEGKSYTGFPELLADEKADKMTGAFRSGWQADYPAIDNFLTPLFSAGAGSNYGRYDSKAFADGMLAAATAKTPEDAQAEYNKVQENLLVDLPQIPLWYANVESVWDPSLKNVQIGWNSVPLYYQITK